MKSLETADIPGIEINILIKGAIAKKPFLKSTELKDNKKYFIVIFKDKKLI
jgi:hypothetical protein